MPGGDQTGPRGGGPKTGRGLGTCAGNNQAGYAAPQQALRLGLGFRWGGRGWGRGRGWQNRFNADFWPDRGRGAYAVPPAPQDEGIDDLKVKAQELQNALQEIQERLDQLEA